MRLSVFGSAPVRLAVGATLALAAAGSAAAEMKLRVQNDTPNPASFTLEGRSKDIRPRKAMSFPMTTTSPPFSVLFANGFGDRGNVDVAYASPIIGTEDGAEYRCISLQEDGIEIWEPEDCAKKVNKPKE